ncbi:MAG: GDP-mannose 4,6-dehydratase [bacterium]|nr:GDP-mannose 4,6-dehydratase [bacterium]
MDTNFWNDKNVFMTGGTGLLGSWMVSYLGRTRARLTLLIRDWVPRSRLFSDDTFNRINIVRGCLEDRDLLLRIINEYEIDTVFHLGAQTIVPIANANPLSTFESNIKGTWNMLEACRTAGSIKRIIAASSDKAYGEQEKLPYDEAMSLQGSHPYDVSKSCADLIAQMYHKTYRLPVCITRCGNFYGGGDLNFNRLIPGTIKSILHQEDPVIRSNGQYIRDYFYIEDAVEAYLMLAEKMNGLKLEGQAFNFSNELQMTVLDIVHKIILLMDSKVKPRVINSSANEIPHQYLSAGKARKLLSWKPSFSLEEGLKRTIEWYQKFFAV